MADNISLEESFEYSLRNFLEWLEVMKMEPVKLCDTWGNYNVAWELVDDLNRDGEAIIGASCSYLNEEQKQEVRGFLSSLKNIPKSVLVSATSAEENQEAMSNPCWGPYKQAAAVLLQRLEPVAIQNRAYFDSL